MKRYKVGFILAVLAAAAGVSGCNSKVRDERTFELEPGLEKPLIIPAPKKDQKIRIEISASEPVSVEIVLKKDIGKKKSLFLKKGEKEISCEIDLPAGEELAVILSSSKMTTVTFKANSF